MEKLNYTAATVSVDSILFDLNTYKQEIYSSVMKKHNLEVHPFFFELFLDGGYQQIERAYIHYNQYRPIRKEMEEAFQTQFESDLNNGLIPFYPESVPFMQQLMNSPLKIGLVSSYRRSDVERLLQAYPLELEYDALVCGNEVMEGKPEKDIYSKISKQLKTDPHYTIAFEATINGVMGAYLASMESIYVEIHKLRVEKAQKFSNYQCLSLDRALALI